MKPNGTDAKDIALYFIKVTTERATPSIISKTVIQAKTLLQSGYTKQEILDVIDYLVLKGTNMFSLGYVNTCINTVLPKLQEEMRVVKQKLNAENVKKEIEKQQQTQRSEVSDDGESTRRNRDKADRFGNESRVGKKFNFDMFERQQQND